MSDKLLPNGEDVPLPLIEAVAAGHGPEILEQLAEEPVDAEEQVSLIEAERLRLGVANVEILNGLARDGIAFDPPILILQLKLRLDMLTELVAPSDGILRAAFERSYEQRLNEILERAKLDSSRAKLLAK